MRIPLEISFHGLSRSESLEKLIRKDAAKLEKVCDDLVSCRIGIKQDQKSRNTANPYRIRIEMRFPPNNNLVVTHKSGVKEAADDLPTAIKNAFKAAQRRLKQMVEKQQGDRKSHPQQEATALVTRIFTEEGYGFIRSIDGEDIYFHRNSVLHGDFDRLEPGTGVHYTAAVGEKGLQATAVQIVDKPGVSRPHEEGAPESAAEHPGRESKKV
ncbi:MAG: HPF/RaiA family ribosome-associated protein [Desulfobulbaceae bacterium]|nr:HPF/RaiA family ribosome-associated protein [Desulfobulbaceae bacterium]